MRDGSGLRLLRLASNYIPQSRHEKGRPPSIALSAFKTPHRRVIAAAILAASRISSVRSARPYRTAAATARMPIGLGSGSCSPAGSQASRLRRETLLSFMTSPGEVALPCVYIVHFVCMGMQCRLKYAGRMREQQKMTETVTIRMTPAVKAALQALADADRRKLASYLALVLEEHVEKHPPADKPKRK
jgi:hypothetical protein